MKFVDITTADHKVVNEKQEPRNNQKYAIVVLNGCKATQAEEKTSQETARNLWKFLNPEENLKVKYTDNSLGSGKPCEDLQWNHCASTPHRLETNGIAKRALHLFNCSRDSMNSGGQNQWNPRYISFQMGKLQMNGVVKNDSVAKIIPFSANVEDHAISAKDQARLNQLGKKVVLQKRRKLERRPARSRR